jgi:hypothetical protein
MQPPTADKSVTLGVAGVKFYFKRVVMNLKLLNRNRVASNLHDLGEVLENTGTNLCFKLHALTAIEKQTAPQLLNRLELLGPPGGGGPRTLA